MIQNDFVTMLLVNMVGALVVLGLYLLKGHEMPQQNHWAPAFAAPGLIAVVGGFYMIFIWPLPTPYNIPFGEMSVFLGTIFFMAGCALWQGWSLRPLTIFGVFVGIASILIGIRFMDLGLSNSPAVAGTGFILTGLGAIMTAIALASHHIKWLRILTSLILFVSAVIWAWIGYMAYWSHLAWTPPGS